MKQTYKSNSNDQKSIHILLADDNRDDRFFFKDALSDLPISTILTTVDDGERLLSFLLKNTGKLPDVLFLDINMPRKNGSVCLKEIKINKLLQQLPVIIYSTSLPELVADELYKNKAHYYVQKTNVEELRKVLRNILNMLVDEKFDRPPRDKFTIGLAKA
ncbi:MAG: response regulator [Burkholderiales bacterium]|nr:response regulator [Bacteroidia bacterium]